MAVFIEEVPAHLYHTAKAVKLGYFLWQRHPRQQVVNAFFDG
jgi:hypothetical protein